MNPKFSFTFILISCTLFFYSCIDEDSFLFGLDEDMVIYNQTHYDLHVIFDNPDYLFPDSMYRDTTYNKRKEYYFSIHSSDKISPLSIAAFKDTIAKLKIYYIEKGDTFFVSNTFYDGQTYWNRKEYVRSKGMIFRAKYILHSAYLKDDMFAKSNLNP